MQGNARNSADQYTLDFTSRVNERCAIVARLRDVPITVPIDGGDRGLLTLGRVDGIVELLQRLTVLARELPDRLDESFSVECVTTAIGARITTRRIVSERTIRRWIADAKRLGVIDVDYRSHQRGGPNWNRYRVNFVIVLRLLQSPSQSPVLPAVLPPAPPVPTIDRHPETDSRAPVLASVPDPNPGGQCDPKSPPDNGGHGRTRADIMSAPGADTVSAPKGVFLSNKKNTTAAAQSIALQERAAAAADLEFTTGRADARDVGVQPLGVLGATTVATVATAAKAWTPTAWTPTSPVADMLRSAGLAHWRALGAEFAAMDPNDVAAAIATYKANVSRLNGPGSLVSFLRTGAWPRDDLRSPVDVAAADQRAAERRTPKQLESRAFEIIRGMRRAGRDDAAIKARLATEGLERFF